MSLLSLLLWPLVALWLAITLLAQHRRFQPLINSLDGFHVIPRWTFFAPNPGVRDYHLVVRERRVDGSTTEWKSVPVYAPRPGWAWLWHPEKRSSKIMNDAIQSIKFLQKQGEVGATGLPFTMPYLLLLRYASHTVPPEPDSTGFQIAIIESTGHDDRKLECSFLSDFHSR
ncbi:MAG TPA: hypothetical protein VHB01_12855 [Nitrosospira sp.]|nr:hypothetical protein [Nitrosospira sp.]